MMDRINEQAQSLFDVLFPKGTVRFLEHRDIIEKALRSVAAMDAKVKPEFEELTGKPIPADELSEAKKFADFDGKEQMMCGWQTVHRELHVIHSALLAVEKERDTLAAEAVGLRSALEKLRPAAPSTCPLIDAALSSSPAAEDWSAAFEALVKEHQERRIEQFYRPLSSEMLRHKELYDAAKQALAKLGGR